MIDKELLLKYGANELSYAKNAIIFRQDEKARYYYEVLKGEVKMCNYSEDGKEFIQGIFSTGRCFGEPPLFGNFGYPAHAIALTQSTILQLSKKAFYKLLKEHPEVHFKVTAEIASRLYYKAIMASEISHEDAGHRIMRLLHYLKKEVYELKAPFSYEVELTRQQIADLTGLRVETAIRAIKKLEKEGQIRIEKRKILA